MPTITLEHAILNYIQEINGIEHESNLWSDWLTKIGCPVEKNNDEHIEIGRAHV